MGLSRGCLVLGEVERAGQREGKSASFTHLAFDAYLVAHLLDKALGDKEAES